MSAAGRARPSKADPAAGVGCRWNASWHVREQRIIVPDSHHGPFRCGSPVCLTASMLVCLTYSRISATSTTLELKHTRQQRALPLGRNHSRAKLSYPLSRCAACPTCRFSTLDCIICLIIVFVPGHVAGAFMTSNGSAGQTSY